VSLFRGLQGRLPCRDRRRCDYVSRATTLPWSYLTITSNLLDGIHLTNLGILTSMRKLCYLKVNTNTKIADVVLIDNEIVRLKELSLLNDEVNSQSGIDVILKSIIHSFEEFRRKSKGKEVCPSFELMSDAMESMVEPQLGMLVGSTSYSEPKGEEDKKETKEDGKVFAICVNKVEIKSKGKAKWICFYCKENGH
jgi:hypothetical protein